MTQKCGYITILGAPNAGKSTLLNQLAGAKISIVTPKVQTTRFRVRAVCTEAQTQMIFVDTPGIFQGKSAFEKSMVDEAWSGLSEANAVLLLVDAYKKINEQTAHIIERLEKYKHLSAPIAVAINKIDSTPKHELIPLAQALAQHKIFAQIFMISALKNDGIDSLKKWCLSSMPEGPWLYPEDQLTDLPMRLLAAEITREKLFLLLRQELPYNLMVETESWEERKGGTTVINQAIIVSREGQKTIILGKGGETLKKIGTSARKELERQLEGKVHLQLFVKVDANWQRKGIMPQ